MTTAEFRKDVQAKCYDIRKPWEYNPPLWADICKHPRNNGHECCFDNCPKVTEIDQGKEDKR